MDINPVSVAAAFLEMVKKEFPAFPTTAVPSDGEIQLANATLKNFFSTLTDYTFAEETVLDYSSESEVSSYSQSLVDDAGNQVTEAYSDIIPVQRKAEILQILVAHPDWKPKTVQAHGGKEFKYAYYRKRWEEQVKRGGTKFEKFLYIDSYVFDKFLEARKEFNFVKERDLQLWGIQAAQSFRDPGFTFKAGHTWVTDFKQRHGISSRKVTKLVGRREVMSMDTILTSAKLFQNEFTPLAASFPPSQILNTDQVGFMYEIIGNRTLSFTGEKDTLGVAKSPTNLATHSYTAQFVISKEGKIVGDVILCLQERSGRLGPQIQENLFPAPDVCVTCSTSGKLTTSLYEYFLDNVIVPNMKDDFLLVVDSWSGQTNADIYSSRFGVNGAPNCTLKIIPKKCTSIVQPLDTTFHRQLKYLARSIYAEAALKYTEDINPQDEVTTRNNIVRLMSLLRNQIGSPIFEPMIRYAWYSAGLTDERPLFLTVKEALFTFESGDSSICCVPNCGNARFVKCAYCREIYCFVCLYYNYHRH